MHFHAGGRAEWRSLDHDGPAVHFAGREATVRLLLERLCPGEGPWPMPTCEQATAALRGLPGHFAVVILAHGWCLASVDAVRGYPLFQARDAAGSLHLSGCARTVSRVAGLSEANGVGVLEFLMAGFVTGDETVVQGLRQLQAGEALLWTAGAEIETFRWYLFHSQEFLDDDPPALLRDLAQATDAIFDRLVDDLDGRPVWVPLSGGLDSRLVAAKLVERGYPSVQTFSYGVPGNHEAAHARKVAGVLGRPWRFVPITACDVRDYMASPRRKAYWDFCDGLCSVPNPQDMIPLLKLRGQGLLPDDAVLVNGQSGDFSCGAHIPGALMEPGATLDDVFPLIFNKHFALWRDMLAPANTDRLRAKTRGVLAALDPAPDTPQRLAALHDAWEWQERQSKYVVNGQRIYDFLGLDWRLPLWEAEWNAFWPRVPVSRRLGRQLHKDWLRQWDYKGLFSGPEPVVSHWPGSGVVLFVLAQAVGLLGRDAKDAWYRYMRWFGHNRYYWRGYSPGRFLREVNQARNVLSLHAEDWVRENLGLAHRHAVDTAGLVRLGREAA